MRSSGNGIPVRLAGAWGWGSELQSVGIGSDKLHFTVGETEAHEPGGAEDRFTAAALPVVLPTLTDCPQARLLGPNPFTPEWRVWREADTSHGTPFSRIRGLCLATDALVCVAIPSPLSLSFLVCNTNRFGFISNLPSTPALWNSAFLIRDPPFRGFGPVPALFIPGPPPSLKLQKCPPFYFYKLTMKQMPAPWDKLGWFPRAQR